MDKQVHEMYLKYWCLFILQDKAVLTSIILEFDCIVVSFISRIRFSLVDFKGRFLLFQVYRSFAYIFSKLSVSTFHKEINKFQQKVQS